jgi:hypothetical protein
MDTFWQVDHRGPVQEASDTLLSQELDGLDAYWTIGGLSIPIIIKGCLGNADKNKDQS